MNVPQGGGGQSAPGQNVMIRPGIKGGGVMAGDNNGGGNNGGGGGGENPTGPNRAVVAPTELRGVKGVVAPTELQGVKGGSNMMNVRQGTKGAVAPTAMQGVKTPTRNITPRNVAPASNVQKKHNDTAGAVIRKF